MVSTPEQPSKDAENAQPQHKQPSFAELKKELDKFPKARSFFGHDISRFSQNDLKRIIWFQSISATQHVEQLENRIKILEGGDAKPSTAKKPAKKTATK